MELERIEHGTTGVIARTYRHARRGVVCTLTDGNVITLRMPSHANTWRARVALALGLAPSTGKRINKRMRALR